MKAEELMIGDWVRMKENQKVIFQMEDVSGTGMFKRWTSDGEYMIPYAYDEIEPVPLTSEILEKNGFVPDNFSPYYLSIEDGSIRFSEHQYGLYCNILRSYQRYDGVCNYVHELQHALKLCGINLEITV